MTSCIGVDLHLRNATLCHQVDGSEGSLRTLELHSAEWQAFWKSIPAGSDVFVEMSRTTWWFARWLQEHPRRLIGMSFQQGIPWRVALQQNPPPLPLLDSFWHKSHRSPRRFQRTATVELCWRLTKGRSTEPQRPSKREGCRKTSNSELRNLLTIPADHFIKGGRIRFANA
jgi:hypothetical protein